VMVLGADRLLVAERQTTLTADQRRRIVRALQAGAAGAALLVVAAVALSTRGLTGTVSHLWSSFTSTHGLSVSDPSRLLSADSANRWVWWREAIGAFSGRPLGGWGAGSFPVVHLLYRHDTISVLHAHSVPLEWLAETGLIGFGLAVGAWALLVRTGLTAVRHRLRPEQRLFAGALLAGALAYSLHALYDWDWDIPGVTIPALILLGTLAGSLRSEPRPLTAATLRPIRRAGPGMRLLGLAAATFGLCVYAASAVLPGMAGDRASDAFVAAGSSARGVLAAAQHDASVAGKLDPFSDAGLKASAAIAQQRKDLPLARSYLLEAVHRQPSDGFAWRELAFVDTEAGYLSQAVSAAQRMLELDPEGVDTNGIAQQLTQQINVRLAPPRDSATAQATPQTSTGTS
jgi:O-Antigen ligase